MSCPALPARPAQVTGTAWRDSRGSGPPGEGRRNRIFARPGEPDRTIEYRFIRTESQILPVTLLDLTDSNHREIAVYRHITSIIGTSAEAPPRAPRVAQICANPSLDERASGPLNCRTFQRNARFLGDADARRHHADRLGPQAAAPLFRSSEIRPWPGTCPGGCPPVAGTDPLQAAGPARLAALPELRLPDHPGRRLADRVDARPALEGHSLPWRRHRRGAPSELGVWPLDRVLSATGADARHPRNVSSGGYPSSERTCSREYPKSLIQAIALKPFSGYETRTGA